jgi:hypothetical protein
LLSFGGDPNPTGNLGKPDFARRRLVCLKILMSLYVFQHDFPRSSREIFCLHVHQFSNRLQGAGMEITIHRSGMYNPTTFDCGKCAFPLILPSSPSSQIGCTKRGTQLGPSLASCLSIYSRRSPPSTFLPQFQWNNLVELLSEEHLVRRALRPSILVAQTRLARCRKNRCGTDD